MGQEGGNYSERVTTSRKQCVVSGRPHSSDVSSCNQITHYTFKYGFNLLCSTFCSAHDISCLTVSNIFNLIHFLDSIKCTRFGLNPSIKWAQYSMQQTRSIQNRLCSNKDNQKEQLLKSILSHKMRKHIHTLMYCMCKWNIPWSSKCKPSFFPMDPYFLNLHCLLYVDMVDSWTVK